jgi:exodeoxyribonuclease VII small subunit
MAQKPAKTDTADIAGLSFEQALKELEQIVGRLESGQVELEESIAIYERGEALKAHCDALLKRAEAKVEKITLDAEGRPVGTEPLDVEK